MRLTLNLLPPEKKRALRSGLLIAYIQTMVMMVFTTAVFISAVLVSVRMMMAADYADLQRKSASAGSREASVVTNEIKLINAYIRSVDARQKSFVAWSDTLRSLSAMVPEHTRLESLVVLPDGKITMTGEADTREEALSLLERLKSVDFLSDVSSPLSNLLQKKDVRFTFEMKYKRPAN